MNDYYVYFYYEQDAIEPFYVGKGHGDRAWRHIQSSMLQKRDRLHNKLRQMIRDGEEFTIEVIQDELTEAEAHASEIYFITRFGRLDLGTGCLCNHTDGGEGQSGAIPSKETRAKLSTSLIGNRRAFGHIKSYDNRIQLSRRPSPEVIQEHIKLKTQTHGIPVESFDLVTGITITKYSSAREAQRKHGFKSQSIGMAVNGKRQSHGGMGWRYSRIEPIIPIDPNSFALKPFDETST